MPLSILTPHMNSFFKWSLCVHTYPYSSMYILLPYTPRTSPEHLSLYKGITKGAGFVHRREV